MVRCGRFRCRSPTLLEGKKLEAEEKRLSRKFDVNTCTTREELATLRGFATGVESDWFPNGVDHDVFRAIRRTV